jgi:exopolysaccharide biosynthesis polyprenyl glycosylphosphotransferase
MLGHRAKEIAYLEAVVDGVFLILAFAVAFTIRSVAPLPLLAPLPLEFAVHFWLPAVAVPLFWLFGARGGLYDPATLNTTWGILKAVLRPLLLLGAVLGLAVFLFQAKAFSRAAFFMFLAIAYVLLVSERLARRAATRRYTGPNLPTRNVIIVGAGAEALEARARILAHPEFALRVLGHVAVPGEAPAEEIASQVLGSMDDLKRLVEDLIVDDVLFAVPFSALLSAEPHVAWCEEVGVTVHLKVDFIRTLFSRTYPSELDGMPMLTMSTTPQDAVALLLKRTVDFVVSSVMLVGLSPLLALCALAVKTTSPGSVYFRQQRVGLNGRIFTLLKFRSMYRDAEERRKELERLNEASGPVFKMRRDPRITPVGRLLRRFSLDELPQLWNVFRGDMSLVGPRPPLPDEVRRYERWQRRRLSMKPGLTCLWQVAGRSNIGFDEWMKLDLAYIDNWSLKLDFVILLRTVPAVVLARGAR